MWPGDGKSDYVSLNLACNGGTNAVIGGSCGRSAVVAGGSDHDSACWSCGLDTEASPWPALCAMCALCALCALCACPAAGPGRGFRVHSSASGTLADFGGALPIGSAAEFKHCDTLGARSAAFDVPTCLPMLT
eukprot:jgi/Ulvmu1/12587/UM092_0017.1